MSTKDQGQDTAQIAQNPCSTLRVKIEQEINRLSAPDIAFDEGQRIRVDVAKRKLQWVLSLMDEPPVA